MIGDNIKSIRIKSGLTQAELAEMINVKAQTVSSWEVGRTEPNMLFIELLADALRCRKSDIIGEPVEKSLYPLTLEERNVILAYRLTDDITRANIRKLLDMPTVEQTAALRSS